MDMEPIDDEYNPNDFDKIRDAGFLSMEAYEAYKTRTVAGLQEFGDHFTQRLGDALEAALTDDALKIMRHWQQACDQANILYRMKLAKEKAANEGR